MSKWKPLPPRPFDWTMKPLTSARTTTSILDDGRRELTIEHEVLAGVTPSMLGWWFRNIEGTMQHMGRTYPRYHVWHPLDHIHYDVAKRAPDGTAGPGAHFHIVEAFGADPEHLIDIDAEILRNDAGGIALRGRRLGLAIMELSHTFTAVPEGTRYRTRAVLGTTAPLVRVAVNRGILPRVVDDDMATAWLRHNVEEVGNLEHFLPALHAAHAGRPPSERAPRRS